MADLADVARGQRITSARQNLINDYIQDGTHKINTLAVNVGGIEVIDSSRRVHGGASGNNLILMSNTDNDAEIHFGLSGLSYYDEPTDKFNLHAFEGRQVVTAKVDEAGGIAKGKVVCVSGASGNKPQACLADNTLHNKAHTLGIANETKTDGQNIEICILGEVVNIDTTDFSEGARLHLTTTGNMTEAVPTSGAHIHLGFATKINVSAGIIFVSPENYVHDIRATTDLDVEIATGTDDATRKILFQNYSRQNLITIDGTGAIKMLRTARIAWTKITANSITLDKGTSSETVTDLQTAHDGNIYNLSEVTGAPGQDLKIDFINVTAFNWIQILAYYNGSATHSVSIQVYNWDTTAWDTFDSMSTNETMHNHSFFLPDDANYIGTDGNEGKVRVRFNHTQSGNASHDSYIDVVALYQ